MIVTTDTVAINATLGEDANTSISLSEMFLSTDKVRCPIVRYGFGRQMSDSVFNRSVIIVNDQLVIDQSRMNKSVELVIGAITVSHSVLKSVNITVVSGFNSSNQGTQSQTANSHYFTLTGNNN